MGCALSSGEQHTNRVIQGKPTQRARTQRKMINAHIDSDPDKIFESVKMLDTTGLNQIDQIRIMEILKGHFFFYGMTNSERAQVISKMVPCSVEADAYLFKQGDPASAFFIIEDGQVNVEINGQHIKSLKTGEYFGELALIYMAPRSASIKAVKHSKFWCITRNTFRQTVEQFVKRNYTFAKSYLTSISMLNFLTEKQKDSIAYNMLSLKYEDRETIYKQKDDANSLFIITEGAVEVAGKSKTSLYKKGECFGEESLEDGYIRMENAIAKGKTVCLSIGRDVIKNILGDKISNIISYNVMKHAIQTSTVLCKLSRVEMERLLQSCRLKSYDHGEVVFKKGDSPHFLAICLEGRLGNKIERQLVGEQYLLPNHPQKIQQNIVKEGTGLIGIITFEQITKVTQKKLSELSKICQETRYEKRMETVKIQRSHTNLRLEQFICLKKLGEGQFGTVYLVKESKDSKNVYAVKCIKKRQVVEYKMEKIILQEKHIMSIIDCPMMLNFVRSFKDEHNIYFVMQYIPGWELFDIIRELDDVPRKVCKFYISSLIICMEYLHMRNIIYRDLKPQNVMVESNGYLKLIDMGTAKHLNQAKGYRTFTMIGTPHYMAPEVMQGKGYTFAVDLWSLGVMLYEFLFKELPFAQDLDQPNEIHNVVLRSQVEYPAWFQDQKLKKLIDQLLNKIPELRLPKGFAALKASPYFDDFSWDDLYDLTMQSPYIPQMSNGADSIDFSKTTLLSEIMAADRPDKNTQRLSLINNWDEQF